MRRIAALLTSVLLALAATAMAAPTGSSTVTIDPTAALRCLTLQSDAPGPQPVYPFLQFKRGKPGRVLAEFRFDAADQRPRVEVLALEGDEAFAEAVRDHARHLRVPCFDPGDGVSVLRMDYRFQPDQERIATPEAIDPLVATRSAQISCVKHLSGNEKPDYPERALRDDAQGRVLARLRFDSTDRPPAAEVAARRSARLLKSEVEHWARDLRMPCYAGVPIEYVVTYAFIIEDSAYGWKPNVDFKQLLAAIPPEQRQKMPPSSTQMGCPFAVEFSLRQPQMPNHAVQLQNWRAERQPFLGWLRGVTLVGGVQQVDWVYGDFLRFEVPCYTIQ